jgi:hypothetical protein
MERLEFALQTPSAVLLPPCPRFSVLHLADVLPDDEEEEDEAEEGRP